MKFGQIIVRLMDKISSLFLVPLWRRETSSTPFGGDKMTTWWFLVDDAY